MHHRYWHSSVIIIIMLIQALTGRVTRSALEVALRKTSFSIRASFRRPCHNRKTTSKCEQGNLSFSQLFTQMEWIYDYNNMIMNVHIWVMKRKKKKIMKDVSELLTILDEKRFNLNCCRFSLSMHIQRNASSNKWNMKL